MACIGVGIHDECVHLFEPEHAATAGAALRLKLTGHFKGSFFADASHIPPAPFLAAGMYATSSLGLPAWSLHLTILFASSVSIYLLLPLVPLSARLSA